MPTSRPSATVNELSAFCGKRFCSSESLDRSTTGFFSGLLQAAKAIKKDISRQKQLVRQAFFKLIVFLLFKKVQHNIQIARCKLRTNKKIDVASSTDGSYEVGHIYAGMDLKAPPSNGCSVFEKKFVFVNNGCIKAAGTVAYMFLPRPVCAKKQSIYQDDID